MRAHHRKLRHQASRTAGFDDDSVVDNNFTGGSSSVGDLQPSCPNSCT
jgi:hypothetical protein